MDKCIVFKFVKKNIMMGEVWKRVLIVKEKVWLMNGVNNFDLDIEEE